MSPYRADLSIQFETPEAFAEAERLLAAFAKVKGRRLAGCWGRTVLFGDYVGLTVGEGFLQSMEEYDD